MRNVLLFEGYNQLMQLDEVIAATSYDDVDAVSGWLRKPMSEITFTMSRMEVSFFESTISEIEASLVHFPADSKRINKIVRLLKSGEKQLPIFVDAADDFILEGRHRIVAFSRLGLTSVDAIYVR